MKFYRYDDFQISFHSSTTPEPIIFYLIKETPCGYWINQKDPNSNNDFGCFDDKERWISKTSRKRFAYPTEQEAVNGYIYRKHRHIKILETQLSTAKANLLTAMKMAHTAGEKGEDFAVENLSVDEF